MMLALIVIGIGVAVRGLERRRRRHRHASTSVSARQHGCELPAGFALTFLMLRGFAEGCVAMTGTEAISNGVERVQGARARRTRRRRSAGWPPSSRVFFLGTSCLAQHYSVMPTPTETVLSQLGRHIFGGGALYYALQYATFAILVLAANTAFADFPRLASILARRRLHAATIRGARRSARVLERHHRARARRDAARLAVPRRHERADPALRDRRVRLLHAVAGRHGRALAAHARRGLAAARGLNGLGAVATARRRDRSGRHEVHARRAGSSC